MERVIWNKPMIILHNIVIMPSTSSHLDVVNKESCVSVSNAMKSDCQVFLVTAKNTEGKQPEDALPEVYNVGVVAKVRQYVKLPNKTVRILLETDKRARLVSYHKEEGSYYADIEYLDEEISDDISDIEKQTLIRMLSDKLKAAFANGLGTNKILFKQLLNVQDIVKLADGIAEYIPANYTKKQELLEELDVKERVMKLLKIMDEEYEIMTIRTEIQEKIKEGVNKNQRDYVLREQLRVIKKELGEDNIEEAADDYVDRLENLKAPEEVKEKLRKEIDRYKATPQMSAESGIISNYIETLFGFPWGIRSEENNDLDKAIEILERDHYGLDDVKERIVDYLAVHILNNKGNMPIICLVGPPGTGKTSIAKSIANATGKEYVRMSLGGVRDEAEIRGHRKTYIGAMPGRIAQSIAKTKTENPLILLDEIDKVSSDYKGDVASALLEVLDSEQNNKFYDHYFGVPIDLSNVLFVATANDASLIPAPLLDRMEIIEISGYTENEKFNIAKLYLVDKARQKNGLTKQNCKINNAALKYIIKYYTREAGVRSLERCIDKVCRKVCRQILTENVECVNVTKDMIPEMLGIEKYMEDNKNLDNKVGSVRGLAWTAVGGVTLDIEVNVMPGTGNIQLTGKLGDVMKESAFTGLSFIRSMKEAETLGEDYFDKHDIHIHIPEGAVPKDGPSAGITMATALYSAIFNKAVKGKAAMTGEITLRGNVLPIGGLKEKLLAAKSIGIKKVIIPEANVRDLAEINSEITDKLEIIPVTTMKQVLDNVLV